MRKTVIAHRINLSNVIFNEFNEKKNEIMKVFKIKPQDLQLTVWTLQPIRKQLHSRILQVIVTQVQLSQTGV